MTRVALYRVLVIAAAVLLLELLCAAGVIDRITMPPPHTILRDLAALLASGSLNGAIAKTLGNASMALVLALALGVACAVAVHNYSTLRETLEPLFATYYAIPVFALRSMRSRSGLPPPRRTGEGLGLARDESARRFLECEAPRTLERW